MLTIRCLHRNKDNNPSSKIHLQFGPEPWTLLIQVGTTDLIYSEGAAIVEKSVEEDEACVTSF